MFAGTTAVTFRSELLLLYAARGVRGFGDGFAVIILPAYLTAIGYTPVEIGIVATAALLGSSLLTLAVGFVAPRHDLRTMLMLGAALMIATGAVFPQVEHIAFVLLVAFVGTINPQSGDAGVDRFRSITGPMEFGNAIMAQKTALATPAGPSPAPAAVAPVAAAVSSGSSADAADALAKLADLRDRGAITAEEFEAKKTEILARM